MPDLLRAFTFPKKHATQLPVAQIVSDGKVDESHVNEIVAAGLDQAKMRPIIVIKHPEHDVYAVLDGHHRLIAARRCGAETIRAAVVDDYIGLGFELTKRGTFQPSPEFTRRMRLPVKSLAKYLERFLKDPQKMLKEELEGLHGRARELRLRRRPLKLGQLRKYKTRIVRKTH